MSRDGARSVLRHFGTIAGFAALIVFNLAPIVWSVRTSLMAPSDIFAYPPKWLDFAITLEHYERIVKSGYFQTFRNSIAYSLAAIAIGLIVGLLAAYGFDRFRFLGKKAMFFLVVFCIPLSMGSSALIIPNYLYFSKLGLLDGWFTLPLLYTAYNLPMAIWIIKSGVEAIPVEIDEAAKIDGCSRFRFIFGIVAVLSRPVLAAAALFIFLGSWNEFILSSIMINKPDLRPVQLAIYQYLGFFGQEWGPLTAAASVAIVPSIVIFTFLGRMLISGLTAGSVKS
jgi:ABC-type glycerol-3-phosphate transport system permease component